MPQLKVLRAVVFLWAFISLPFCIHMYVIFHVHGPEEQNGFGHTCRQNIKSHLLYFPMQCYAIQGPLWATGAVMCGCMLPPCGGLKVFPQVMFGTLDVSI